MARPKSRPLSPAEIQVNLDEWNRVSNSIQFSIPEMTPVAITFDDGTTVTNPDPEKLSIWRARLAAAIPAAAARPFAKPKEVA